MWANYEYYKQNPDGIREAIIESNANFRGNFQNMQKYIPKSLKKSIIDTGIDIEKVIVETVIASNHSFNPEKLRKLKEMSPKDLFKTTKSKEILWTGTSLNIFYQPIIRNKKSERIYYYAKPNFRRKDSFVLNCDISKNGKVEKEITIKSPKYFTEGDFSAGYQLFQQCGKKALKSKFKSRVRMPLTSPELPNIKEFDRQLKTARNWRDVRPSFEARMEAIRYAPSFLTNGYKQKNNSKSYWIDIEEYRNKNETDAWMYSPGMFGYDVLEVNDKKPSIQNMVQLYPNYMEDFLPALSKENSLLGKMARAYLREQKE